MKTIFYSIALIAALVLSSCSSKMEKGYKGLLLPGDYMLVFDMDTLAIPAQLHIDNDGEWSVVNWTERIDIDSIVWIDSTFKAKMPLFNTTLTGRVTNNTTIVGKWTDHAREPLYEIPVHAKRSSFPQFPKDKTPEKLIYSVLFSPEIPLAHDPAIGVFYRYDSLLYGTFLTGSGDHRFLQGRYHGDRITLSGFDGAHLFHYSAQLHGDSIVGKFYSGKHHSANWAGVLNAQARLVHPDSVSKLKNPDEEFRFKVRNDLGDSVLFNKENLSGKVSIVQVSGSWCANCTDEAKFFKALYDKYNTKGLQIIPVAFERSADFVQVQKQVHAQYKELGLTYLPYYGGQMGKGAANKVFTGVENITAYPTSIFLDKQGVVRKIHTGFYGPGTGIFYEMYTTELESFIQMLLNEK